MTGGVSTVSRSLQYSPSSNLDLRLEQTLLPLLTLLPQDPLKEGGEVFQFVEVQALSLLLPSTTLGHVTLRLLLPRVTPVTLQVLLVLILEVNLDIIDHPAPDAISHPGSLDRFLLPHVCSGSLVKSPCLTSSSFLYLSISSFISP